MIHPPPFHDKSVQIICGFTYTRLLKCAGVRDSRGFRIWLDWVHRSLTFFNGTVGFLTAQTHIAEDLMNASSTRRDFCGFNLRKETLSWEMLTVCVCVSAQYFATTMVIVGLSVIATVLVLQYHYHDPDGAKMPRWVREKISITSCLFNLSFVLFKCHY